MKYPIPSIILSLLIWFFIIIAAAIFLNNKPQFLTSSIDIEVNLITKENSDQKNQNQLINKLAAKKLKPPNQESPSPNSPNQNQTNQKPSIIYRPLPQIPDDLRQEAFRSYAIARFYIDSSGAITVELIKPCSNPRLNYLLLKSLKKWQFTNIQQASIQDIRVEFKVE